MFIVYEYLIDKKYNFYHEFLAFFRKHFLFQLIFFFLELNPQVNIQRSFLN